MFYPELKGPPLDAYRKMIQALITKAKRELNLGEEDLIVRSLIPNDLTAGAASTNSDYYIGLTAVTWTAIVDDVTIDDNRFIGINGVSFVNSGTAALNNENVDLVPSALNAPTIELMRITRKGSVARYWDVKPIGVWESHTGYVDDPIILDQNTTVKIEGLARIAGTLGGRFDIIGAVVEKRGLLINPLR